VRLRFLLLILLFAQAAFGQEVNIGGDVIMRVESAEAARVITEKIENRLAAGAPASAIRVEKAKEGVRLVWGDTLLVTITKSLAEANASNPVALAALWAGRLRALADTGLLRLKPARLVVPVNGDATVEVAGLATGAFSMEGGEGRVEISEDSSERLRVTGRAVGKTKVVVHRGKAKAILFIHVKDWAGYPPDQVTVKVVGNPAPGAMVAEAALRAVSGLTRVNPGCKVDYGAPASLPSIPAGESLRFSLPIRIEGNDDYYPVARDVPVQVSSITLEPVESNLLLVSNRPEQVDADGILMDYTITKKEPSRLMYSHMNSVQSPGPRNLWVNLINPGKEPVEVLINWAYAGPSRNEVLVGHTAAQRYLEQNGSGYVLTVPPRHQLELASHELQRRDLISGFTDLRILSGEKLQVQVLNKLAPSANDGSPLPNLGAPFNPFKIHPHGVFAQPFFEEWWDYKPGQPPLVLRYGESPWLIDFETGLPNTGNFGVLYRWHVTLTNPTRQPVRIGMSYQTIQGPGASSILVNGVLTQANFRPKGSEGPLAVFELAPGQEKVVDLVTLPEASSNYPAGIQFRELQPGEVFEPETPQRGSGRFGDRKAVEGR